MSQTTPERVPSIIFKTRVRDESIEGENPYRWQDVSTDDICKGKRVAIFALPGAFTPTCSSTHLPGFEMHYDTIKSHGIDEIYCLSVNDAFVMFQWAKHLDINKVKMLPDGSGFFTKEMGMLVKKDDVGMGERSWRYSMIVSDGVIEKLFEEAGKCDNCPTDPYKESGPETMLSYLTSNV